MDVKLNVSVTVQSLENRNSEYFCICHGKTTTTITKTNPILFKNMDCFHGCIYFTHSCSSNCLYYEILSFLNATAKHFFNSIS